VKLSRGGSTAAGGARRRGVFIDGGIHAREWISPAAVLHVLHTLATTTSTGGDSALSALVDCMLDKADWYIVPSINPDGYEYTRTNRRYWRKNRGGNLCRWSMQTCCGTDLNRNFPFQWGVSGASTEICTAVYQGESPLSEPETHALANTIRRLRDNIDMYLSIHSFGQQILVPYGYAVGAQPSNYANMTRVAQRGAAAMTEANGVPYTADDSASLYPAGGGSDDWVIGELNMPYSYTIELRPNPAHSRLIHFDPPRTIIQPTGKELLYGTATMLAEMLCIDHGSNKCASPTDLVKAK